MPACVRLVVPGQHGEGCVAPVHVHNPEGEALGFRLTTVYPDNAGRGRPVIQGAVLLVDPVTGALEALVEGVP